MKNLILKKDVKISLIVTISSFLFLLISLLGLKTEEKAIEGFAFLSLVLLFFYGIYYSFMMIKKRQEYIHLLPFLILNWFIGCFSTNVFINIFENLPLWVYLITFMYCLSLFVIYLKLEFKFYSNFAYFINGLSIAILFYFAFYLIPFMLFSAIGILALGMGFYGLVPLISIVIHIFSINNINPKHRKLLFFYAGLCVSIAILCITTFFINKEVEKINKFGVTQSFDIQEDIPTYIKVSQNFNPNFLSDIVLKKGLVYEMTDDFFRLNEFRLFNNNQYNDRKIHDPLLNIAFYFSEELNISRTDQVKILQSNFDKRLETEEQLWSGENLTTKNIKEDVQIFPETRLAYTEFTIDVASESEFSRQEGIYSFQLPENSVATSLSLWVNGIERKGVLTTKEKAKNAYNQIVGVEARDPSLMQWREGNRVVVRVFPISYDLPRTFKCGFTTPLKLENNNLIYQNIDIKGPRISNVEVLTRLQIENLEKFTSEKDFDLKNGFHINKNNGLENWKVTLQSTDKIKNNSFAWKNKIYETLPIDYELIDYKPSEIIIDLNKYWTIEELKELLTINQKIYYVHNNSKKEINSKNYKNVLAIFQDLHYSLLPIYNFKEKSLIITKSNSFSANFEELKESIYLDKIKNYCKNKDIKVYNISNEINPFWQTMKEQNYVTFVQISLKNSINQIQKNQIKLPIEYENGVNVENAQITIFENTTEYTENKGSNDHIYRMFAFGKVMTEHVENANDSIPNPYVMLAQDANIVTPITSLIVLETDEDYKKHGIEKNINGLGNASVKNEGAVPEPHEWALIFMSIFTVWYMYFKQKKTV